MRHRTAMVAVWLLLLLLLAAAVNSQAGPPLADASRRLMPDGTTDTPNGTAGTSRGSFNSSTSAVTQKHHWNGTTPWGWKHNTSAGVIQPNMLHEIVATQQDTASNIKCNSDYSFNPSSNVQQTNFIDAICTEASTCLMAVTNRAICIRSRSGRFQACLCPGEYRQPLLTTLLNVCECCVISW